MENDAIWRVIFFKWVVIRHQLDWGKALWKPRVGAGKGDSGDDREFFVTWTQSRTMLKIAHFRSFKWTLKVTQMEVTYSNPWKGHE